MTEEEEFLHQICFLKENASGVLKPKNNVK